MWDRLTKAPTAKWISKTLMQLSNTLPGVNEKWKIFPPEVGRAVPKWSKEKRQKSKSVTVIPQSDLVSNYPATLQKSRIITGLPFPSAKPLFLRRNLDCLLRMTLHSTHSLFALALGCQFPESPYIANPRKRDSWLSSGELKKSFRVIFGRWKSSAVWRLASDDDIWPAQLFFFSVVVHKDYVQIVGEFPKSICFCNKVLKGPARKSPRGVSSSQTQYENIYRSDNFAVGSKINVVELILHKDTLEFNFSPLSL